MNYRPVSLTCIACKLFKHIICKHILAHLEDHKILTDLQHGFRSGRSCETQLVTTFQDLAQMHNKKGSQIYIAVLDFSKVFDMVSLVNLQLLCVANLCGRVFGAQTGRLVACTQNANQLLLEVFHLCNSKHLTSL